MERYVIDSLAARGATVLCLFVAALPLLIATYCDRTG